MSGADESEMDEERQTANALIRALPLAVILLVAMIGAFTLRSQLRDPA